MLAIKASTHAPSPARLLKPAAVLASLRPLSLAMICYNLAQWDYLSEAVKLARQFDLLRCVQPLGPSNWDGILREVLDAVEKANICEIDWDMLDADYQYWMKDPENGMAAFAQWLYYIPVARYGFSDYDDNWPEQYPPMALLKGLLVADWGDDFLVGLIDNYGLEADWNTITHYELVERLTTADFSAYDAPLCWLPNVARIACAETGNPLLDYSNRFEDEPTPYEWGELDRIRELWQQAKPEIEKLRAFLTWCDGPAEMQATVNALVGRGEWKRKRKRRGNRKLKTLESILTPTRLE